MNGLRKGSRFVKAAAGVPTGRVGGGEGMTVDDILEDLTEVITHARRYRLDS